MRGDEAEMEAILQRLRRVAVVGLSPDASRDSHRVAAYLQRVGIRVVPVNPTVEGELLGARVYASTRDVPGHLDAVVVFRRSHQTDEPIDDAIAAGANAVWLQLGIVNAAGLQRARAAGLRAVHDRCIMVEDRIRRRTQPAS